MIDAREGMIRAERSALVYTSAMTNLLAAGVVILAVIIVLCALGAVARHMRRRGMAGPALSAAMAAYDEAMHSTAYTTFVEMQQQDERKPVIPAPKKR